MKKYILDILESEKEHAGSKAKTDISFFLHDLGYLSIFIDREIGKVEKYLFARPNIKHKLSGLKPDDLIVLQYPFYAGRIYLKILMQELNKSGAKTILILHDIFSLRSIGNNNMVQVEDEVNLLNNFNVIISHNNKMTDWLKAQGVKVKIINLDLFDYYNSNEIREQNAVGNQIVFAGNLAKAGFLNQIKTQLTKIVLYGPNSGKYLSKLIEYRGVFAPDALPRYIEGNYGLVWDGDSSHTCGGEFGEYLRLNDPHKVSLYISCGLPVIIWDQAALAEFITCNQIGLTVDSLDEMDAKIASVSDKQYEEMKTNVRQLAIKVRSGYFIKTAVQAAEKFLASEHHVI